jgi:hypothetical protein
MFETHSLGEFCFPCAGVSVVLPKLAGFGSLSPVLSTSTTVNLFFHNGTLSKRVGMLQLKNGPLSRPYWNPEM